MSPLLELLATFCAALFAGAALYIDVAEHPARMRLDTRSAVAQWVPSYARASRLQLCLATVSFIAGAGAWLTGCGLGWCFAGALIGLVIPVTLLVIMPVNRQLLAPARDFGSAETRGLLERWARLHSVRTALSVAATAWFLWLLLKA